MKIVHVNLSRSYRGGEHQMIELIKELKKLGLQQEVVCRRNALFERDLYEIGGIGITEVSGPLSAHLKRGGNKLKDDLIHAHDGRAVYWAWLEKLIRSTPYIITRRVINPIGKSSFTSSAYHAASKLVAVSRYASEVLSRSVNKSVSVIYDGCREFQKSEVNKSENLIGIGNPIIGHVGVIDDSVKGQSILIEAFLLLLEDYPNAKLYLIGGGKDLIFLQNKYKTQNSIIFVGSVNNVQEWYSIFDLFCFPSRIEALGSSVLEAMTLEVPVIVSNVGGLPELIGDNERGVAVQTPTPENWYLEIKKALENPADTTNRVMRAKCFANQINARNMAKRYFEIYNEIISHEAS